MPSSSSGADRVDHAAVLPVVRLAVLRRERDQRPAVVAVREHRAAVDVDDAPVHATASISAGRCGSNASRQHVQLCASRTSAEPRRVALRERARRRRPRCSRGSPRPVPQVIATGIVRCAVEPAEHRADEARDPPVARERATPACRSAAGRSCPTGAAGRRTSFGWRRCACSIASAPRLAPIPMRALVRHALRDLGQQLARERSRRRARRRSRSRSGRRVGSAPRAAAGSAPPSSSRRGTASAPRSRAYSGPSCTTSSGASSAGRLGRRVEQHVDARDEAAAADLEAARPGPASAIESSHAGGLVLRATRRPTCRRTGRARAAGSPGRARSARRSPSRYSMPVDARRARSRAATRRRATRTAGPRRGRDDLLPEHHLAVAVVGIGQRRTRPRPRGRGAGSALLLGPVLPCADLVLPDAFLSQ